MHSCTDKDVRKRQDSFSLKLEKFNQFIAEKHAKFSGACLSSEAQHATRSRSLWRAAAMCSCRPGRAARCAASRCYRCQQATAAFAAANREYSGVLCSTRSHGHTPVGSRTTAVMATAAHTGAGRTATAADIAAASAGVSSRRRRRNSIRGSAGRRLQTYAVLMLRGAARIADAAVAALRSVAAVAPAAPLQHSATSALHAHTRIIRAIIRLCAACAHIRCEAWCSAPALSEATSARSAVL